MARPPSNLLHVIRRLAGDCRGDTRSDAELLTAFANTKDEWAFTALVARHGRQVWARCVSILGESCESQVDDCFQAVFIALARKANAVSAVSLPSWLAETARRTALEARRRDTRRHVRQHELADRLERPTLAEGRVGFDGETASALRDEIDHLPDKLRTPVVLFYLEGRTQAQAAAFLGCDQSVVSRRLTKALSVLRQRLESRGMAVASTTLATWLGYLATTEASVLPRIQEYNAVANAAIAAVSGTQGGASPTAVALATAALRPRVPVVWLFAGGLLALGGTGLAFLPGENPSPHTRNAGFGRVSRDPAAPVTPSPPPDKADVSVPPLRPPAVKTGFVDKVYKDADGFESKYVVFVPQNYDGTKDVPVILFLHGSGETKGGQKMPVDVGIGPAIRTREKTFPFLTVIPQAESRSWLATGENAELALAILDEVVQEYKTDARKVYLTGVSTGGTGTWSLASAHPERWAAIVPICGRGDVTQVEKIKDIPCWCFHGGADRLMPASGSRDMIDAIRNAGGKPTYFEYPEAEHKVWDAAYNTDELYKWLMKQSRK